MQKTNSSELNCLNLFEQFGIQFLTNETCKQNKIIFKTELQLIKEKRF